MFFMAAAPAAPTPVTIAYAFSPDVRAIQTKAKISDTQIAVLLFVTDPKREFFQYAKALCEVAQPPLKVKAMALLAKRKAEEPQRIAEEQGRILAAAGVPSGGFVNLKAERLLPTARRTDNVFRRMMGFAPRTTPLDFDHSVNSADFRAR